MKNPLFCIILLMTLIISSYTYAGTVITPEMGEKYFENCVSNTKKQGTLSSENQKKFCACTAINMQKSITQEDIRALSYRDKSARLAMNKILIDVNGPCMQYPVYDLLNNQCMADLKNTAICSCLSGKMALFTKAYTQKMLPQLLKDNPEIYDPMTPIMESTEFQRTQQNIALSCATNPNQK